MRFKSKPCIIEAEQFKATELLPFKDRNAVSFDEQNGRHYVTTIHGDRAYLADGDWIVPEPDGKHFYPIKPDIFAKKYEPE